MNDNKICFIICSNNKDYLDECKVYINRLIVPDNYEIELLVVEEARSMTSGYNEAMKSSDAKYKVYMHQDVFITDIYFLQEVVDIFKLDYKIGLIGMAGSTKLPADGIMWHGDRIFAQYSKENTKIEKCIYHSSIDCNNVVNVEAIDGFLMVTQYDILWREDIFDGWDFYDLSQSQEFIRKGYSIVVPLLDKPMCVHDDGYILNLENYDRYRQTYLTEYSL